MNEKLIIETLVKSVQDGKVKIEDVPEKYRTQVEEKL